MNWHQKEVKTALAELDVPADGLTSGEAARRLAKYGPNELVEKAKRSALAMFLDQFRDFMILILIAAAVVSGFVGDLADTIAILVIVILNAVIGFVQEYRAEKAMEALKQMAAPVARVLRDGSVSSVPGSEIVPGDLVLLEAGGIIPADMRLTETAVLKIEEAALTGESVPVEKHIRPLREEMLPLGDRSNMVFKGTVVTYGRGTGVVVGTGMDTELGKIATMLQEEEEVKTPLQKRLTVFGKKIAVAILFICAFIFGVGLLRGEAPVLMFLTAVSLAVAAIPEALPAVITISLALGARKMVEHNALIRKLPAVETLGSVTTICSDKTGTLTLNRMTVEEVYANGKLFKSDDPEIERFDHLLKALALSNDALPYSHDDVIGVSGDPTEIALYRVAKEHGFAKADLEKEHPRVSEIPFDSERKCMTTFHRWPGGFMALTKGGVDVMLEKTINVLTDHKLAPIDADEISRVNDRMADGGLRVLAVAARLWNEVPDDLSPEHVETGLTFLGLTVISGFIITHQNLFRFLAGFVLILIGIRVFLSVPSAITAKTEHETYLKDYLSMVALAIANPLTLVFFLVILPGYGFVIHGTSYLSAAEFVAGVFFGSTVWWVVLCGFVGSVRSRISVANLGLINRVSGLLISCFGTGVLILLVMSIGLSG